MLAPDAAVVTCVEADHLDNYADLAQIEAAFARLRRPRSAPAACWSPAPTTRAPGSWPGRRPGPLGPAGADLRHRGRRRLPGQRRAPGRHGRPPDHHRRAGHQAPRAGAGPHRGARPAQRAQRGGRVRDRGRAGLRAGAGRGGPGRLRRRAAPDGAQGRGRRGPGGGQLRPSSDRAGRRPGRGQGHRGRRPGHRAVPAAPVQPDPDLRRRLRRGAQPGRRGRWCWTSTRPGRIPSRASPGS